MEKFDFKKFKFLKGQNKSKIKIAWRRLLLTYVIGKVIVSLSSKTDMTLFKENNDNWIEKKLY